MAFPTLVEQWSGGSTASNATSWSGAGATNHTLTIPANSLWICVLSSDGNPTLTDSSLTFNKLGQASNGNVVTGAIFYYVDPNSRAAGASPIFSLSSTASEQYSAIWYAFSSGTSLGIQGANSNGSSTNSDPPNLALTGVGALDVTWIATRSGDSTVVASAGPTNYTNFLSRVAASTSSASTDVARRNLNASAENPGTFTSATEQWVCWTLGVYLLQPKPVGWCGIIGE